MWIRRGIGIVVRSEWVNFKSWVNYPFKKNDNIEILVNVPHSKSDGKQPNTDKATPCSR